MLPSPDVKKEASMKGTRPLDNDEIRRVSKCFTGTFAVRNRGLFMVGVSTGGRISELLSLKIGDVWQNGKAVIAGENPNFGVPLIAHELGHAFGLYHNIIGDASIMRRGRDNIDNVIEFNDYETRWLDRHHYFNDVFEIAHLPNHIVDKNKNDILKDGNITPPPKPESTVVKDEKEPRSASPQGKLVLLWARIKQER